MEWSLVRGEGRTQVSLQARVFGSDLIVWIFNSAAHVGAVAVGEWDFEHARASVSVITRLGHKDDSLARQAAYTICKATHRPVCAVAGVHLDDITLEEIAAITENTELILQDLAGALDLDRRDSG